MKHTCYAKVLKVIEAGIPVLLEGEAGSGKSTIAQQIAQETGRKFTTMSMTKQTSVNAIIGFKSVTGNYISSLFREAYENGHLFLLDEIDAADPNVLLCLNTIENGYVSFPDKRIEAHPNFRLIATSNPHNEHSLYTGRSTLDFSTRDRYHTVLIDRDSELETKLTSKEIITQAESIRKFLKSQGSSIQLTMRDTIRSHKLIKAEISKDPFSELLKTRDENIHIAYNKFLKDEEDRRKEQERIVKEQKEAAERQAREDAKTQHEVDTYNQWWSKVTEGK